MAFYPSPDATYRIVIKHSGKCLAIAGGSKDRGARVVQATILPGSISQLFKFRKLSERHYAVTSVHSDKNMDVEGNSTANGTNVIQWDQSDGEWNEHFRFDRSGVGSYHIIARHSGKGLAIHNGLTTDGAELVHTQTVEADHYRFWFVPDGSSVDRITSREFVADSSELTRTIILGVIGKVPEVGSGLSGLLGVFWPSGADQRMWAQMKAYVTALVRELIAEDHLRNLSNQLAGIRLNLQDYAQEPYNTNRKRGAFDALLASLNAAEPFFFDAEAPERTLPYFVALGTIRLAALREFTQSYQDIYREPDQNAALHLKELIDKIALFTEGATRSRARALEWRLAQIVIEHDTSTTVGILGPNTTHTWRAHDLYDNWTKAWSYNSMTGGDSNAETLAGQAKANRVEEIRSRFGAELDLFLGPARLWPYLNPTTSAQPKKVTATVVTGPFGGLQYTAFADKPQGKPITKIVVNAGARVDGVEVFYGGVSGGLHGARGGSTHTLELAKGETIVGVWGRAGAVLDALHFMTSLGRSVGGGAQRGTEWIGDPDDKLNATLAFVTGRQGTAHMEALAFTWEYAQYV